MLNVFSALSDTQHNATSSFYDFDKVVLIGDYTNIKHIFQHKYGEHVDFGGYFDKVVNKVFALEKNHDVYKYINDLNINFNKYPKGLRNQIYKLLRCFFSEAYCCNLLNLRKLFKVKNYILVDEKIYHSTTSNYTFKSQLPGLVFIEILLCVFGNYDVLLEVIDRLNAFKSINRKDDVSVTRELELDSVSILLPILELNKSKIKTKVELNLQDITYEIHKDIKENDYQATGLVFERIYSLERINKDKLFIEVLRKIVSYCKENDLLAMSNR